MAFKFQLDVDSEYNELQSMNKASKINTKSQNENSIFRRAQSSINNIKPYTGKPIEFPKYNDNFQMPIFGNRVISQNNVNLFTPVPPIARNQSQRAIHRMVKKYSTRYQYIWILITNPTHQAIIPFQQIYQQQKLSNVDQNLENIILPQQYYKAKIFTQQGLDTKIMIDYQTYKNYIQKDIKIFENNTKVLQIFVQNSKKNGLSILTTKKIKNVSKLYDFINNEVKIQIDKCRKDIAYYNYIHSNSGPQLYNRRTIIKSCLTIKNKQQVIQNNYLFIDRLMRHTIQVKQKQIKIATQKKTGDLTLNIQKINHKYNNWIDKINKYSQKFDFYIKNYYPIQQRNEEQKRQFYNWILCLYCDQSAIYPVINNTIRYSLYTQKINSISTYVKYLFDSLRFYFTTKYRQIGFKTVYRGSRISLVEQRSFIPGRYLWNLGFTSTSLSQSVANGFIAAFGPQVQQHQKVLVIIKLSHLSNQLEYLWDQQGYFALENIFELRKFMLPGEQQILFNPLNVFQILKWDNNNKILQLKYAPQLQIIEKKKRGVALTDDEKDLMRSIYKLKDKDFDKGQQYLQQGNPGSAIKYYEQSHETGTTLSFSQKANYIRGLMQVGSIQKMQTLLSQSIQQQKKAQKRLQTQQQVSGPSSLRQTIKRSTKIIQQKTIKMQKLSDTVLSLTMYEQIHDFEQANKKAENTKNLTIQNSIQVPSLQSLLLQTKTYIELSKIKYGISQTQSSIKQSIRSLKIIDQLANVNLCYRIYQLGNTLKRIKNLQITSDLIYLSKIINENKYLNIDIEKFKQQTLTKISQVRNSKLNQQQQSGSYSISQNLRSSRNKVKQAHSQVELLLKKYFKKRDKRTQVQIFQQIFVFAYWQIDRAKINKTNISQKQQIQQREKLKTCKQILFDIKNDYKQLFDRQVQAYQVLYRNIYKTSIDVQSCLKSYHKNVYSRYQQFMRNQQKYQGDSLDIARVLYKHGEILLQYGQIIQKSLLTNQRLQTQSQKQGSKKIKQSQQIIYRLQKKQKQSGIKKSYTYQKTQINNSFSRYFKSKTIQKQKTRKLAIIKNQDKQSNSISLQSLSLSQQHTIKSKLFQSLLSTLNSNKQLHQSDTNINQSLYLIKDVCQKIQILNQSSNILIVNQSYIDRLKSCKNQFQEVLAIVQKYKEKQRMERNLNMAQLYLLMSQNQFRLGLIDNSKIYLNQSNLCISRALKLNKKYKNNNNIINKSNNNITESQKNTKILDQQKLLLGNKTKICCLRLQSHIAAFFGSQKQKLSLLQYLRKAKTTMFQKMNQPLNQADINQSIGIISSNLLLIYKQLTFNQVKQPFLQSINIRQKLLGPYNKYNARDYTMLVQLISIPNIQNKHSQQIYKYYMTGLQIYNRIDLSLDSTLILYKMQLQSTYYIYTYQQVLACNTIIHYLQLFSKCPNNQQTLQIANQLYRSSGYLSTQASYQKQGLIWLKYSYQYAIELQKFINKNYKIQNIDKRKIALRKLKVKILDQIVQVQRKTKGKQLQKYIYLLKQEKQKYLQQKNQVKQDQLARRQ